MQKLYDFHISLAARDFRAEKDGKEKRMKSRKHRQRKKGRMGLAACVVYAVGLCFSASATSTDSVGPTANVWLDVVELSSNARISVTVPISYGFVVLGTTETSGPAADEVISTANRNLYLPNVRVEVTTPSSSGVEEFRLSYVGTNMILENYSTNVREVNMDQTDPEREGLLVELRPYIVDSKAIGHFWQVSLTDLTPNSEDFMKYRMVLDGKPFSVESKRNIGGILTPVVVIRDNITLPAPSDVSANGYTAAGTARVPTRTYVPVDVEIGGRRGQYNQAEQSINVARIYWEVIPGELP